MDLTEICWKCLLCIQRAGILHPLPRHPPSSLTKHLLEANIGFLTRTNKRFFSSANKRKFQIYISTNRGCTGEKKEFWHFSQQQVKYLILPNKFGGCCCKAEMEVKLREWGTCSSSSRSRRRNRRRRLMIVSLRAGTCPRHRCYPLDNNVSRKPGAKGGELRVKEGLKDVGIDRICFSELLVYFNNFQTTIWMQLHTN